jgi:hypothetical protein
MVLCHTHYNTELLSELDLMQVKQMMVKMQQNLAQPKMTADN